MQPDVISFHSHTLENIYLQYAVENSISILGLRRVSCLVCLNSDFETSVGERPGLPFSSDADANFFRCDPFGLCVYIVVGVLSKG